MSYVVEGLIKDSSKGKHNRSFIVAVQGPDYGPSLIYSFIHSFIHSVLSDVLNIKINPFHGNRIPKYLSRPVHICFWLLSL
jgi:hypothetical protein